MQLRSTQNGGIVVVDESFGQRLLEGGKWEAIDAPKPERKTRSPRTKTAPVEEQKPKE